MSSDNRVSLTLYDEVNSFLQILLNDVQVVLGDYFTGMYLYGSLASGDFDRGRSDIDPLVVTRKELPENLISDLEIMHKRIYESGPEWGKKMSGAYIPLDAMRKYDRAGPACPLFNRDQFLVARPDIDWVIHRHILYVGGIVIAGPPLRSLIDPVRPDQLREASSTLLRNNWSKWVDSPDFFNGTGYQPFVVLTMCRALYTIKHGDVASKRQAAEWLMSNSDRKWTQLIKHAIAWHYGDPPGDIGQTQEFMRYVFREAGLFVEEHD